MTGSSRRHESLAERRERRATVDDPAIVLDAAAHFLVVRSRSVAEVRRRLTGAGYRPDLIDGAIERMIGLEILDDAAFARAWVESRDRARPRGERAIRSELGLKGVERAIIDAVLADRRVANAETGEDGGPGPSPDSVAAERLLARHGRVLERVSDPRVRRQRAYALLARHGFDPDACSVALQAWLRTEDAASSLD